jgi:MFS transporter, FHS family, L-fucose permease
MSSENKSFYGKLFPVLSGFFIMGMVDVVGVSTSYVKHDFRLRDSVANLLPLMVFIWFALLAVPTGVLMNRLGRRRTVLIGMGVTLLALLIPLADYRFSFLLAAFALIGIGNMMLQVALNPLLSNVVREERLTSALTLGQLIKAVASFLGPVIAVTAASWLGSWKMIFPVFAGVTGLTTAWLALTPIDEDGRGDSGGGGVSRGVEVSGAVEVAGGGTASSVPGCLRLLKDSRILSLFLGVVAIVGLDVGLNTTIPKFLMERCDLPLERAGLGTSLYFIARTLGSFAGVLLLTKIRSGRILLLSAVTAVAALSLMLGQTEFWRLLGLIFILGLSVANVFPIVFAAALRRAPAKANEISGLMIMGVSGGAILLPVMGLISDRFGQAGGLLFLLLTPLYLLGLALGPRYGRGDKLQVK